MQKIGFQEKETGKNSGSKLPHSPQCDSHSPLTLKALLS